MLCVSNLILIFWGLIYAVRPVMQPRDQLLAQCMFINVVIILTVFKYALSFWCSSAVVIYVLKRSSLDLTDGVRHVKSVLRGSQISLTMRMTVDEVKEKKNASRRRNRTWSLALWSRRLSDSAYPERSKKFRFEQGAWACKITRKITHPSV